MRAGLYEARSLISGGSQMVVLDDAEFRVLAWRTRAALDQIARLTTDPWVKRIAAAVLRDVEEG